MPPRYQQNGVRQDALYLLSQQAQDISNNDDAAAAAAALGNLSGPGGYSPLPMDIAPSAIIPEHLNAPAHPTAVVSRTRGGSSPSAPAAPAPKTKKPPANKRKKGKDDDEKKPAPKKGKRAKAVEKEFEMDDFDDPGEEGSLSPQPINPNETEEDKRKNFLERNRQAALKCRQRKKAWLANLQSKVEYLTADNDTLHSTVSNLKDEVASLRAILSAHANCPLGDGRSGADRVGAATGQVPGNPGFSARF